MTTAYVRQSKTTCHFLISFISLSHFQKLIDRIVREELAEIEEDIELQDLIIKELMEDCDQWLLDDYEKTERFFNDPDNNIVQVFCPICQVNLLNLNENIITCACGLR